MQLYYFAIILSLYQIIVILTGLTSKLQDVQKTFNTKFQKSVLSPSPYHHEPVSSLFQKSKFQHPGLDGSNVQNYELWPWFSNTSSLFELC